MSKENKKENKNIVLKLRFVSPGTNETIYEAFEKKLLEIVSNAYQIGYFDGAYGCEVAAKVCRRWLDCSSYMDKEWRAAMLEFVKCACKVGVIDRISGYNSLPELLKKIGERLRKINLHQQ